MNVLLCHLSSGGTPLTGLPIEPPVRLRDDSALCRIALLPDGPGKAARTALARSLLRQAPSGEALVAAACFNRLGAAASPRSASGILARIQLPRSVDRQSRALSGQGAGVPNFHRPGSSWSYRQ